jgi:membrane-bound ClpP family serine protease
MGAGTPVPPIAAATALILGINLLDLIPNATVTPITMLMAGALLGWAETLRPVPRAARAPAFRTVL